MRSNSRLALFDMDFLNLLVQPDVLIGPLFLGVSHMTWLELSSIAVNDFFNTAVEVRFRDFCLVFMDRSVSKSSACVFIFIPNISISMSGILSQNASSFTV